MTNSASGESADFEKLPAPGKLAKMYPEGCTVKAVSKLYALPATTFMQYADEVTD